MLAIHPGPVGDVLLAVPALRALKAAAPDQPLVLAAQPAVGSLLAALGAVDDVLAFEGLGLQSLFVEDDTLPEVTAVRRASRIVCWFGARDPVFTRRLRALAPTAVVASPTGDGTLPVWQHVLASLHAGLEVSLAPCDLSPAARRAGGQALIGAGWRPDRRLVIAHPGAGSRDKRWAADAFVEVLAPLCARADVSVVLHEGPADADAVARVDTGLAGQAGVLRGLPLVDLAGALAQATAYVGNDSGVSHLAATVGRPSVILFGEQRIAWRPWSASADVVLVEAASAAKADVVAVARRLAARLV